jgi:signal transduction histidine kinase
VLDSAVEQIGEEIANLRALITELRPAALDELGLKPALDALFDRARTAYGLDVGSRVELTRLPGSGVPRLHPEIETAVYRVIQESLTNAARHARADKVQVEVIEDGADVQITVRDDGQGFDIEAPSAGFGLTSMRERVVLAGGRLEITSSPAGTTIHAALPAPRGVRQKV